MGKRVIFERTANDAGSVGVSPITNITSVSGSMRAGLASLENFSAQVAWPRVRPIRTGIRNARRKLKTRRGAALPVSRQHPSSSSRLGMITVAIIEDNRLVCECMTDMLNKVPDVKVVLAATSPETAMLKEANPRVVLLDIGLPDTNCLHVAETIRKEMPASRVIVMAFS